MAYRTLSRLSRQTFKPLFWALTAIYLVHLLVTWYGVPRLLWVQYYLNDFLCLPLLLTVILFLMRLLYGAEVKFTLLHVAFVVVYASLAFEWFFPQFLPRYTSDPWDVALYAAGGFLFHVFLNK